MRTLILCAALLLTGCAATSGGTAGAAAPVWQLVYSHDGQGQQTDGSKEALIAAVRAGKPVRVYWAGRTVEHVADTFFLTILGGEVFAQIETIQGQAPSLNPPTIEFRDNTWRTILSTNGERSLKWFTVM